MEHVTRHTSDDHYYLSSSWEQSADLFTGVFTRNDTLKILLDNWIVGYTRLVNLCQAFDFQFNRSRDRADLDKSIKIKEVLLNSTPGAWKPRFLSLVHLGCSTLLRNNRFGNTTDLL